MRGGGEVSCTLVSGRGMMSAGFTLKQSQFVGR